ncbi:phytanoyl-CoA dioxygenase domain-containing 1 [Gonapodya prolifera JEL478]|uniref:Phytanoyl-CoA dioxygenase domain-containing 1 n=1 Tax=Gonapodya prolifera (strain JEL478) TaxID=1344416 RepID=A0A139A1D8_GONPJ|nr:phytanoyl-CoA dioxygenase domain-containing 1 [Gonapodya prolifera JEL478]|eukprot:KXS10551.1 phytanoyl-CoA dioxygenase domain-containing 1 [Gonapodya prolifera JEL478]
MPSFLTESQLEQFDRDGYLLIPGFLSENDCEGLRNEADRLVDEELDLSTHPGTRFTTTEQDSPDSQTSDVYFMTSGDKVRFFLEPLAVDQTGKRLLVPSKRHAVNKIGHALHLLNPVYRRVSSRPEIKSIARDLGFEDPILVQSMAILKPPRVGGEVSSHQDASFLGTRPLDTCVGFWWPMEKAEKGNGCLWVVPGSHKGSLKSRMVETGATEQSHPQESEWLPVEVDAGTLVLIHGRLVHKSEANTSQRSRYAYTFHVAEDGLRAKWDELNWLQPSSETPFTRLYDFES